MQIKLMISIRLDELREKWGGEIEEGHEDKGKEKELVAILEAIEYLQENS